MAQRLDRVHPGGPAGREEAEHHPHRGRKAEGQQDHARVGGEGDLQHLRPDLLATWQRERVTAALSRRGLDGLPVGEYLDPPLTTFSQSAQEAGGRVARMLVDRLDGKEPTSLQALAKATLIRRASDGAPAKTPEALATALRNRLEQQPPTGSKGE